MVGREDMTMTISHAGRLNRLKTSRDWHKKHAAALADKVRDLKDAHRAGYEEGCRATTLLTYLALSDYGLDGLAWISDRILAVATKKPAPHSNEIDELVTRDVIASMKKYSPKRAAEVEKEFQNFLAGDSTK
jgi:hypothetical protein